MKGGEDMKLWDYIGSKLEDVHLLDVDEEHEVATIVELHQSNITEKGKKKFENVLNAEVVKVYNGYYGLTLELSGSSARKIEEFQYALAGYCSVNDYEKWFRFDE